MKSINLKLNFYDTKILLENHLNKNKNVYKNKNAIMDVNKLCNATREGRV